MANSLAELKVLGLERFLDLRLPVPRRMLLLLLLLRRRGRAGGQAVQHLPDVEFPHGLGGAPPQPGRGGTGVPRRGRLPGAEGSFDRGNGGVGVRGQGGSWGEAKDNPNRKYCDKRGGRKNPGRRPLFLRGRRCLARLLRRRFSRRRRLLAPRPGSSSSGGGARVRSAQPHLAAGGLCAAPPPRLAPADRKSVV